MPAKPQLSVLVLTFNEERNLGDCLATLEGCYDDLHIVDSFSTDRTREIATQYSAQVVQHAFEGHSRQRSWALKNVAFRHDWVLALDADHRITPELNTELRTVFATPPASVNGLFVKRRQIFRGRWIKFGGYYPKYMLKVFRVKSAYLDDDEFDYRFYVSGPTGRLRHAIDESNQNEWNLEFFIAKHNRFALEQATEELRRTQGRQKFLIRPTPFGNPDQQVLWLKTLWYGLPLFVRPFLMFFLRYILLLGFLDGKEGLVFHFNQTLWFRLLVDTHLDEMRSGTKYVFGTKDAARDPLSEIRKSV